MTVFTYSETRQRLAAVLDSAKRKGEALIQRRDGSLFRLVPVVPAKSPLDIEGVDSGVSSHEILAAIFESRSARKFK
jgi:antitoxin (DNA-binding transcriptional repressor) of toxin-antitoxin stability system